MSPTPRRTLMALAILAVSLASTARALPPEPFIIERDAIYQPSFGDQFYGAVCAGDGEYFAAWVDLRWGGLTGGSYDIVSQRIRPDGTVVHPGSLTLMHDPTHREASGIPAVAFNGSVYLTVWYEGPALYGCRTSLDGAVLDPNGFLINIRGSQLPWPAVASDGQDFLVVQAGAGSVTATRISAAGSVIDGAPITISSGASGLGYPKLAFGGGVYLVTWAQTPAQAIRAARITPAGQVLDPGGLNISGGGRDVDAHVDFDGSRFYVVWSRGNGLLWDIWGTHVSPAGIADAASLVLDGPSWGFVGSNQIAFNGTRHLIAITTNEPVFSNTDLYAMLVDIDGNPESGPFPVSTLEGRSQTSYGAAAVGDQFFIVWEGNYVSGVSFVYDTEASRITTDGEVLDRPVPIAVSTSAAWQVSPAASFDGTNFLTVFEDRREPPPSYQPDLYAIRVSQQGVPLESTAFKLASGSFGSPQQMPDAVFGLGQHAIVYENASSVNEIRFIRVRPDGTVLDPEGRLIFANEPTGEALRPKIACNGQTYCVVWYDNYFPTADQQALQFAIVRADGTIAVPTKNIPNSRGGALDGFEITSNGNEYLLAWTDFPISGSAGIRVTRISAAGAVLGTQTISTTGNWITEYPQAAWNGESYLVAWTRWNENGPTVYARRVSAAGSGVGATVTVDGPSHPADVATAIFAIGTDFYLTGWRASTDLALDQHFLARFDAAGALQGPVETLSSTFRGDARGSAATSMTPDRLMLSVEPIWTTNPYNAVRLHGRIYDFGPGCAADLNGDGLVDFTDYLEFLNLYDAGDLRVDFTRDGIIDFTDYLEFLNRYDAGC